MIVSYLSTVLYLVGVMFYLCYFCLFVRIQWCPTRLVHMYSIAGVLYEAGTDNPQRAAGFTPVFGGARHLFSFLGLWCFFCVFFLFNPVSCVSNVAIVSGLSVLYCSYGFSLTFTYLLFICLSQIKLKSKNIYRLRVLFCIYSFILCSLEQRCFLIFAFKFNL